MKKQSASEIANLFRDRCDGENIVPDIFDYLDFDCTLRGFLDPEAIDGRIREFYRTKNVECLTSVVEMILCAKETAFVEEKKLFLDIKAYVAEHLSLPMTVRDISKEFHIGYYYLSHLFRKLTGQSISQYVITQRLEKAIPMLLQSKRKISDIAMACGFNSFSYFSEVFRNRVGESPSRFRQRHAAMQLHPFYDLADMLLAAKMPSVSFLDRESMTKDDTGFPYIRVHNPNDGTGTFLHEAAIVAYKGVLYASWYNCKEKELLGVTPIVGRRSYDGGKTWTDYEIIASDESGKILYCPPVYGISEGRLYLLLNTMVGPDYIHSLDLYVLDETTDRFEFLWSRPIPFKLNTAPLSLPNGKLILPGRIGEVDGFPNTPAVMISDSGKIDAPWRVVKVAENGELPDGARLVHPEATLILCDNTLYMFNRNDQRRVPLVYVSHDLGEHWSEALAHDIPYVSSKIYAGLLSDGRFYLIANTDKHDRSRLALYISKKGELKFTKQVLLVDCANDAESMIACHYPAAVEENGKLYIIATAKYKGDRLRGRGAVLFTLDLHKDI